MVGSWTAFVCCAGHIRKNTRTLGASWLRSRRRTLATAKLQQLLAVGARATSTYFENARMLRRQTHAAVTDALTGLGNRRRLTGDLDLALRAGLDGRPSTLVFFDLNGFKRYNDSFGHGAGDVMLRRLGAALAHAITGHGRAYRLGGDEFCLLLSGRFPRSDPLLARAHGALAAHGRGFAVVATEVRKLAESRSWLL